MRNRWLKLITFTAVLGASVIGLSQCRVVGDQVTGLDLSAGSFNSRADCVHACNEQFKSDRRAEDARHEAALDACDGDRECVRAEQEQHRRNHLADVDAMQDCKRNCYNEGSGSGGR